MTDISRLCMRPADWDGTVPASFYVEAKIDGVRALAIHDKRPRMLTRGGMEIAGTKDLTDALAPVVERLGEPCVFDGELVAGTSFEETNANVRAGRLDVAVYHVFDFLPAREWRRGGFDMPYDTRRRVLEQAWADATGQSSNAAILNRGAAVHLLNRAGPFDDVADADKLFEFARERGGEGIVIKDAAAPYLNGKSAGWIRRKVRETIDLPVVGTLCAGGKPGLVCFFDGKNVEIFAGVPSGDVDCPVAEIAHLGITSNGMLRSPSFVRWRADKAAQQQGGIQ